MSYSITRLISKSRKPITILFTDIVDSTRLWDVRGDVKGRLLVDQHNRLVFPVVKKFHGDVVKTIGDSVMATFLSPEHALRAAIGIQQALANYRNKNKHFNLEIRIGMHTGMALIERSDVFGDAVNVAARIEGCAKANEILISGSSEKSVKRNKYYLSKIMSFTPKGKMTEMAVFKCDWEKLPSQIEGINFNALLPMMGRQRHSMFIYISGIMVMLYFVLHNYLRYIFADRENVYLLSFSPEQILTVHPIMTGLLLTIGLAIFVLIKYLSVMPVFLFRLIKGGFGYSVVFALSLVVMANLPDIYTFNSKAIYLKSKHLFVEVLQDEALIREKPSLSSKIIKTANTRDLFLLADVREKRKMVWNKVLIGAGEYGWIAREIPPSFGVAEKRLTITNKFYFKYSDLYALLIGSIGFLWGFLSFSIRPL